jgi:hypothetical protein
MLEHDMSAASLDGSNGVGIGAWLGADDGVIDDNLS